jgi:hypothetical protein
VRNALLNIAILLVGLLGTAAHAPAADGPQKSQKSASKTNTDLEIEQNIRTKLAKSKLAADHFTVSVAHGVATIEGVTGVPQHKGVMTRMAKASGAVSVRNNIRMSAVGKVKTTAVFAKTRSRTKGVPGHTGSSVPVSQSPNPAQIPHATVLPPNVSQQPVISNKNNN